MAAANEAFLSKIECRYFRIGACRRGKECRYSHSFTPDQVLRPSLSNVEAQIDCSVKETSSADSLVNCHELMCHDAQPLSLKPDLWVTASEFIPGQRWKGFATVEESTCSINPSEPFDEYSGYAVGGMSSASECCVYGMNLESNSNCYVSTSCMDGNLGNTSDTPSEFCDMCGQELPPASNEELRNKHLQDCINSHEEEMELSFAVQRSQEKVCGVCMEVVWEKEPDSSARFGILSSCSHVFCLSCIRRWRASEQFEKKTVRGCPECRVQSDFVVPSRYWFDDQDGKNKLIDVYKAELRKKHCRHFARGFGKCPFNEKCFYLHAYPDGRIASPRPTRRRGDGCQRRRRPVHVVRENDSDDTDSDDDTDEFVELQPSTLYEIIEELNERVARLADQLENSILRRLNLPRTGLMFMAESDDES